MSKVVYPMSPPEYSGPGPSFDGGANYGINPGAVEIMTPDRIDDTTPPPAYDSIFVSEQNSRQSKPNVHHDDRNLWEKVHEWFEFSILQQIIWLGAFVFAITYISFGLKYAGQCFRKKYDGNGKTIEEEDLPSFMKAEGGVLCALVLYVFCWRLIFICDRKRTRRINKADLEGRKKCGGYLFFFCCGLCFATFVLCILGATKVFQFHDVTKNHTLKCNDEFYNFYHDTKIGQMAILIPYAVYIIVSMFIVIPKAKNWFMRHKWHQWASLLDADQDGIISSDDMKKTNATLEQLRLAVGDRRTALNADAQNKWWDDHIFKRGANKHISVEDYVAYLEGIYNPADMGNKMRPVITGFFNFFSTPDFRKKNCILTEEDFIKFWTILKNVDKVHCRNIYIRHFLNPTTMESFLGDFVALVSSNDFFDENTIRVHTVLKPPRSSPCDTICHPSCCGV
ncbi:uncharacterized protein [Mytilus edulis]|uniref:uncharacterized protein n=1 Tax=Mytilus edulis TaxID=6550 RepID=UPI0039F0D169